MNTIHWAFIARHAVWILGLAIVLAVWSYADWQAHSRQIAAAYCWLPRWC